MLGQTGTYWVRCLFVPVCSSFMDIMASCQKKCLLPVVVQGDSYYEVLHTYKTRRWSMGQTVAYWAKSTTKHPDKHRTSSLKGDVLVVALRCLSTAGIQSANWETRSETISLRCCINMYEILTPSAHAVLQCTGVLAVKTVLRWRDAPWHSPSCAFIRRGGGWG